MNAPHNTASVSSSLSAAVDRADRRLAAAAHDAERAHRQVERALHQGRGTTTGAAASLQQERRRQGRVDPWVDRVSTTARQLARHSADLASQAGHQAQASWNRYADVTTGYIARQPMRSVLIAAAVGAGVALLLAATRQRS